ncbi:HypC/HybG/HupF family hydrogenase formation chaperone [Thermococcus peptonophilus]|uniref:Hydrogenase n=1 Tax=Thermococcus peptonophilus TaxID=53952 RepID=A0A142CX63_9EURY|nr:HypC/HybG/HupF family hydrogenase formation chaperone [Thermococcus peptonophilus]AMQ19365.1 hydrogenase [Thermococcus peptonophilus]
MCLATIAKVIEVDPSKGTAWVDFGGVKREARIDLMPDVKPGEYVLIHTGFIIERVDEETAKEILNAWEEVFKVEPDAMGGYYYPGD